MVDFINFIRINPATWCISKNFVLINPATWRISQILFILIRQHGVFYENNSH